MAASPRPGAKSAFHYLDAKPARFASSLQSYARRALAKRQRSEARPYGSMTIQYEGSMTVRGHLVPYLGARRALVLVHLLP